MNEPFYRQYLTNLLSGNRSGCAQSVKQLLDVGLPMKRLYTELFQRSLYEVGSLWEHNQISVAAEHLATAITENLMVQAYPQIFSTPRCGHKAIVTCAVDEYHQIGAKMVADLMELQGWDAYFLGPNTPARDLLSAIGEHQPDLLCLSLSMYFNLPPLLDLLGKISTEFPALKVLVGGQAFQLGGRNLIERFPTIRLTETLDDLETFLHHVGP